MRSGDSLFAAASSLLPLSVLLTVLVVDGRNKFFTFLPQSSCPLLYCMHVCVVLLLCNIYVHVLHC